jgi:hypothetical protein
MDSSSSVYYQHSGGVPLASRLSAHVRKKMFDAFVQWYRPDANTRVLDVGVTSDTSFQESNFFEHLYPWPERITCVGTEDGSYLTQKFPGLAFRQITPGEPLPFSDRQFDLVFSNAVLEHTGCRASQRFFVEEICRVGRAFFITTPNRWFPMEHHTGLPLLHYLPAPAYRGLLRQTKYRYWAEEKHLNILTAGGLRGLFPKKAGVTVKVVRLCGAPANLIAYGRF